MFLNVRNEENDTIQPIDWDNDVKDWYVVTGYPTPSNVDKTKLDDFAEKVKVLIIDDVTRAENVLCTEKSLNKDLIKKVNRQN